MEAVAATRAKGLLIVNATDELVSADMQPGRHSSVPTAILRKSAGEALLQLLEKKPFIYKIGVLLMLLWPAQRS